MVKRVFLVHGWDGGPDKDWLPWAKTELEKLGHKVNVLATPDPEHPRLDKWIAHLHKEITSVDENTILIGHSMGCRTILGFLEELPDGQRADKVILVAGWVSLSPSAAGTSEEKEIYESWIERNTDYEKVKTHANSFTAIFSDNDPYVPYDANSKTYEEELGAKIILLPNMGHFSEDAGVTKLPILLDLIKMSAENDKKDIYASAGVDYDVLDRIKRLALDKAFGTSTNPSFVSEVPGIRGESAYVAEIKDLGDLYLATILECLGTKALVADAMRPITGRTYYDQVAQDTVAMATNDLTALGAIPQILHACWAVGKSEWFANEQRSRDLIRGWFDACNIAGVTWAGGESPALSEVVMPEAIDLACSCVGIIKPKENLVSPRLITPGDVILVVASSGIHANGLSLARKIAKEIPQGYATRISDGRMYGEALLDSTIIYAPLINDLQQKGIKIHYMVNITGHGWRKLMRAERDLTYKIDQLPSIPPVLEFIQEQTGMSDEAAYGTLNMGAGFALILPREEAARAQQVCQASTTYKMETSIVGQVEEGPRRVVIKPKNIIYGAESLQIR